LDPQQGSRRDIEFRCFTISRPRNHRYLPNTRTNRVGFCICTCSIVAERQYGAQFPEKLDLVAAVCGRVGGQDQLVDQASSAFAVCSSVTSVVGLIVRILARMALSLSFPPEISTRSGVRRSLARLTEITRLFTS